MSTAVRPPPLLKQLAYDRLKDLLLGDGLAPGETLSERRIAEMFGMGLAPVRSAIERLKAEGLLEDAPNTGFVVPHLSLAAVHDFYETRIVIERHIVGEVVGRITNQDCTDLAALIDRQADCAARQDARGFQALDIELHLLLARRHGNREMMDILENLRNRMDRFTRRINEVNPRGLLTSCEQHREILGALADRDGARAAQLMQAHLEWGRSSMLSRDGIGAIGGGGA